MAVMNSSSCLWALTIKFLSSSSQPFWRRAMRKLSFARLASFISFTNHSTWRNSWNWSKTRLVNRRAKFDMSETIRVALDAMGGDRAPGETVLGAVEAAREYGIGVYLVGQSDVIEAELAKHNINGLDLPIE